MKCSCFPARDATGREIHTPSCESRMTAEAELADRKRELVAVINERNELRALLARLVAACWFVNEYGANMNESERRSFKDATEAAESLLSSPSPQPKGA